MLVTVWTWYLIPIPSKRQRNLTGSLSSDVAVGQFNPAHMTSTAWCIQRCPTECCVSYASICACVRYTYIPRYLYIPTLCSFACMWLVMQKHFIVELLCPAGLSWTSCTCPCLPSFSFLFFFPVPVYFIHTRALDREGVAIWPCRWPRSHARYRNLRVTRESGGRMQTVSRSSSRLRKECLCSACCLPLRSPLRCSETRGGAVALRRSMEPGGVWVDS